MELYRHNLFRWSSSQVADFPDEIYRKFMSDKEPVVTLYVHCKQLPQFAEKGDLLFEAERNGNNNWGLYRFNNKYLLEIYHQATGQVDQIILLSADFTSGDIYIIPKSGNVLEYYLSHNYALTQRQPVWPLYRLMRPFSELLVIKLLSQGQGILAHGLGVNDDRKGLIFIGPSNAGKTTLAKFFERKKEGSVLNDDRIIIKRVDGEFMLYGTPWNVDFKLTSAAVVPLKKIFFIHHGKENRIELTDKQEAFASLFSNLFSAFWNRKGLEFSMKFCDDLVSSIPCYELGFVNDEKVMEFVLHRS